MLWGLLINNLVSTTDNLPLYRPVINLELEHLTGIVEITPVPAIEAGS